MHTFSDMQSKARQSFYRSDPLVFFVTDLHGRVRQYEILRERILEEKPDLLIFGGDLLPPYYSPTTVSDFLDGFLVPMFRELREKLSDRYPAVMLILGNDDPATAETNIRAGESEGLWYYLQARKISLGDYHFYGYSFIPPSPFLFKDWEKYDISRYVDPGCIPPDEGKRSLPPGHDPAYSTIREDLASWLGEEEMDHSVLVFHCPPYQTALDRAALDGQTVDHVPLDVHIGSMAIERFIRERQPYLSLHGHVHESTRLTGTWLENLGRTVSIQGAGDGGRLVLVRFKLGQPAAAERSELS